MSTPTFGNGLALPLQILGTLPGDMMTMERPHPKDHSVIEMWEPQIGGASCRCATCGLTIALSFIIIEAETLSPPQTDWIRAAIVEAEPLN